MKNIYLQILEQNPALAPMVLATVIRTLGSTPQKPGSSALFTGKGLLAGTVGGGVVEGKIHNIAMDAIQSGESCQYSFDLANDISRKDDAICGGEIDLLVDANLKSHLGTFEKLKRSIADRSPGILLTRVADSNRKMDIKRFWITECFRTDIPGELMTIIEPEVIRMLSEGRHSRYKEMEITIPGEKSSSLILLEPVLPPEQLVIAGAGHIGKALARLGNMLDFEVSVIDDRPEYANTGNIPDADHIIVKNIGNAMVELPKNKSTYVVIVTRGHKDDAEALKPCIGADLAYTGMIGSKNKIAAMKADFMGQGLASADQWEEIYAPVGLDIKSQTVEEIAVSIAAQLVQVRNSRLT